MNIIGAQPTGRQESENLRAHIARHAKDFKLSWVQLGQGLYSVWRDNLYRAWGFEKFEDYCGRVLEKIERVISLRERIFCASVGSVRRKEAGARTLVKARGPKIFAR